MAAESSINELYASLNTERSKNQYLTALIRDARRQIEAKDRLLEETIQRLAEVNARMDNMLAGSGH